MKTEAEMYSLAAELDARLAALPTHLDWQSRREIYEFETEQILERSERAERWPIFCHLHLVACRHKVAVYFD